MRSTKEPGRLRVAAHNLSEPDGREATGKE